MDLRMVRIISLTVLFFLLNMKIQGQEILRIKFVYGSEDYSLPMVASCTPSSFSFCFEEGLNFLITYDKIFVDNFSKKYQKLHPQDSNKIALEIDPRIMSIIEYSNDIPNDTVCFGKYHGVCKNGSLMEDDKELLILVKQKIGWKQD